MTKDEHHKICTSKNPKTCLTCRDFARVPKAKPEVKAVVSKPKPERPIENQLKEMIAIDFDGVIHDYKFPVPGRRMGSPLPMAKECITHLAEKYCVIIYTVWPGETIEAWLTYYQIPFDKVTNIKPNAKFYIDDKAIRFENWEQTIQDIAKYE